MYATHSPIERASCIAPKKTICAPANPLCRREFIGNTSVAKMWRMRSTYIRVYADYLVLVVAYRAEFKPGRRKCKAVDKPNKELYEYSNIKIMQNMHTLFLCCGKE